MSNKSFSKQRKIFGGTNFVVVLWALISILRLAMSMKTMMGEESFRTILAYMIPLFFLVILNIFIGITLFLPQKKNKMWLLSLIIVTSTLVVLSTFQAKITDLKNPDKDIYTVVEY